MATMTLTQCATAALRFLGVLYSGEAPSAQQLTDALDAINNMIENWSSDRLMALSATRETVATISGIVSYALPVRRSAIEAASILSPAPQMPLQVVNAKEWSQIPDKGVSQSFIRLLAEIAPDRPDIIALMQGAVFPTALQAGILIRLLLDRSDSRPDTVDTVALFQNVPFATAVDISTSGITNAATLAKILRKPGQQQGPAPPPNWQTIVACMANQPAFLFYDRGNPTGTIYLAGAPQTGSIELLSWTALTQFADLVTAITMLPGYARMLQLSAAMELAPQYNVQPSPILTQDYQDATSRIRQLNASILGIAPATEGVSAQ